MARETPSDQRRILFAQDGTQNMLNRRFAITASDADADQSVVGQQLAAGIAEITLADGLFDRPRKQTRQRHNQRQEQRPRHKQVHRSIKLSKQPADEQHYDGVNNIQALHASRNNELFLRIFGAEQLGNQQASSHCNGQNENKIGIAQKLGVERHSRQWKHNGGKQAHNNGTHARHEAVFLIAPQGAEIAGELITLQLEIVQKRAGSKQAAQYGHKNPQPAQPQHFRNDLNHALLPPKKNVLTIAAKR